MADLQRITHGEPNWDTKVNAIIDSVNSLTGGAIESSDGIVVSGKMKLASGSGYNVVKVGGQRLVEVNLNLTPTTSFNASTGCTITLPSSVSSNDLIGGTAYGPDARFESTGEGIRLQAAGGGDGHGWNVGDTYGVHLLYLLK